MSNEDVKAVARQFFEAQDVRGGPADDLCAEAYRAHLAGYPEMDLAGHQQFSAGFYAAFPDLRHDVQEVLADGDVAAVRFRLAGTNTGAFLGNPPTGAQVDVGAIALLTIAANKVTRVWGEFDQLGLLQQIGALPSVSPA